MTAQKMVENLSKRSLENQLQEVLSAVEANNEGFKEAYGEYTRSIIAMDNEGWEIPHLVQNEGMTLSMLHQATGKAREMTAMNPLLKRGAAARGNLVFGKGAALEGDVAPRFRDIIADPTNQRVLFSIQAQIENEKTLFTDGTLFTAYDSKTRKFIPVPLSQISDMWVNPDDPSDIWYYQRSYTYSAVGAKSGESITKNVRYWIKVDTNSQKSETIIKNYPVHETMTIVDLPVNSQSGQRLGVPDCLPALPWAWAYSEGLRDGLKLMKALSAIAWLVKQKSAKGVANVGAKIATQGRGAGQTAVATEGTELSSMPRSNAVDLTTLRPIASQVATALELSTVAIISDSGAASGSNAAEATLDLPTSRAAETRQELWKSYYKRIFRVMGIPADRVPEMNFPRIDTQPAHRFMQALTLFRQNGGIWAEEYRDAGLEALDVLATKAGVPDDMDTATSNGSVSGQGVSGTVGAVVDGENAARTDG